MTRPWPTDRRSRMPNGGHDGTNHPGEIPRSGTEVDHMQASGGPAATGYSADTAALIKRLRRIEGQVRGLQRMVENDAYCIDILTQVSASTRALEAVALHLLDSHLRHCVADATTTGQPAVNDKITEASEAIRRLVRS